MKFRIFLTSIVVCVLLCGYYYLNTRQNDPLSVVQLIKRNTNPKDGSITDYAGDIHFRGFESVGYEPLDKGAVRVYFGDLQFDLKPDDLDDKVLSTTLKEVGFTIQKSQKTGELEVYYRGKKVSLYGERKD